MMAILKSVYPITKKFVKDLNYQIKLRQKGFVIRKVYPSIFIVYLVIAQGLASIIKEHFYYLVLQMLHQSLTAFIGLEI